MMANDSRIRELRDQLTWVDPAVAEDLEWRTDEVLSASGNSYPIINGIARFVTKDHYAVHFGQQWLRHRKTQLDSHLGMELTAQRLRRCLGDELWCNLAGQKVLEVGCGAGRFTEVLLEQGARVVSVDLSAAVEANQSNFPQSANHLVVQADVRYLPLAPQQFDVVVALGMIQHTPDSEETIGKLIEQVKPDGYLVIDHYSHPYRHYTKIPSVLLRPVLKRLKPSQSARVVDLLVNVFLPLHRVIGRNAPLAHRVFSRFSPLITYFHYLPEMNDAHQREFARLDTYDSLTDWYRHLRGKEQIRKSLASSDLDVVRCEYGGIGVEARAQRAQSALS